MAKKKGERKKQLTREGEPMYVSLSARAGFSRSVNAPRARTGATSVHTNEMPRFSEAPVGARVIDSMGAYAVCLASADGRLLGLYRR